MKELFDVVIIGGGIAGMAAALQCHQHNLRYAIILGDTKVLDAPFQTTASESVHPGFETLLDMFSLGELLSVAQRGRYSRILTNDGYTLLSDSLPWEGYHLDKPLLLKGMFTTLIALSGVYIMDKVSNIQISSNTVCKVLCRNDSVLSSRFIIDASGNSQVSGKLLHELKKYYSPLLMCSSALVKNIPQSAFSELQTSFLSNDRGWTWLAPEMDNSCTWTALSLSAGAQHTIPIQMKEYEIIGYFVKNVRWRLYEKPAAGQIFKVGDAAGLIDPAAGQGILNAFMSGVKAADLIYANLSRAVSVASVRDNFNEWYRTLYFNKVDRLKEVYKDFT